MWILRSACLLLGLAVPVYPWLPPDWFRPRDPASGEPFTFNRSHTARVPFHLLWALEGFRRVPLPARAVVLAGLCALTLAPAGPRTHRQASAPAAKATTVRRGAALVAGCAVLAACLFYFLRVPYERSVEFGDAPILPAEVESGMVPAAEVATYELFHGVRALLGLFADNPPGLLSIALSSCLAGGVFVAAMLVLARAAGETLGERVVLFCGGALSGYAVMFFGYVETTQLALAAMALYFGLSARVLRSPPGAERLRWLILALAALALALMAHAAGILLLPSAAVLLCGEALGSPAACRPAGSTAPRDQPGRAAARSTALVRNAALAGALVLLPYLLVVVVPFYLQGEFGNIRGGGDQIMLVPWQVDPLHPPSRYVYYSLLSGRHLADLLSALLVAAPLALPLGLCAGVWAWRGRALLAPADRWWLSLLAAAAAACLLVPLLWNHDFGMWGDWNLAACYLFPLNLLAWSLFIVAARPWRGDPALRRLAAPLLVVQLLLAAGFLLQLW